MSDFFVYLITNNLNQKRYVGKTNNLQVRWKHHKCDRRGRSYIGRAIRKYGASNFNFTVLDSYPNEEEAYRGEVSWISHFQSNQSDQGYNLDSGGVGGKRASEETRRKQSLAHKGVPRPSEVIAKLHSPEARRKVAEANQGKVRSESTKRKISEAHLGRPKSPISVERSAAKHRGKPVSEEHRAKLSVALRGRVFSSEHRAKLAVANVTNGLLRRGKPLTQEHKDKVSSSLKGRIVTWGKPLTQEHKGKLSLALKGKPKDPEHLVRLSEANRVNGAKRRGVPLTPERRANMSASQKG